MLELIPGSSLCTRIDSIPRAIQHSHYGKAFRCTTEHSDSTSPQQTSAISSKVEVADFTSQAVRGSIT
jgi:hypothetical protein